jgi:hypothetical protein
MTIRNSRYPGAVFDKDKHAHEAVKWDVTDGGADAPRTGVKSVGDRA